jgi:hypothetical protein
MVWLMPGEDSNSSDKFFRNQGVNTVGLLSYPENYPSACRTAVIPLGAARYRVANSS